MRRPSTSNCTPATLQMWRERMGWLQKKAAQELGVSERTYQRYEEGSFPIPLPLWRSCKLFYLGTEDFRRLVQPYTRENLMQFLADYAHKDSTVL